MMPTGEDNRFLQTDLPNDEGDDDERESEDYEEDYEEEEAVDYEENRFREEGDENREDEDLHLQQGSQMSESELYYQEVYGNDDDNINDNILEEEDLPSQTREEANRMPETSLKMPSMAKRVTPQTPCAASSAERISELMPDGFRMSQSVYDAAWSRLLKKIAQRSAEDTMVAQLRHRNQDVKEFSLETFHNDVAREIERTRTFSKETTEKTEGPNKAQLRTPLLDRQLPRQQFSTPSRLNSRGDNKLFTPLPGERSPERLGGTPSVQMDQAVESFVRAAQIARFRSRRIHAGGKPPIFG
mmetsp:Transcript_4091/g.8830  ORF Transcript_4091/g.8830 Transcript_4091/m.8830 type:complete len:300 (+) Transcript_4091:165-1064(+)